MFTRKSNHTLLAIDVLTILCDFASVAYILLTVYVAKRIADGEDMNLNKLVSGAHAFGVVFQAVVEFMYYWAFYYFGDVALYNMSSFSVITNTFLDVALCCVICHMVHENWQMMVPDADSDSEGESFQPEELQSESEGEPESESDFATFSSKYNREAKAMSHSVSDFNFREI